MSTFTAMNPRDGTPTGPVFPEATAADIAASTARATATFDLWRHVPPRERATALRAAAHALARARDAIIETADRESALGKTRLGSELARTVAQLDAFADLLDDGAYVEAILNVANPAVTPPQPELRRMLQPLGPVAVFTPSNFPLAYGVAGGDTASALAAGCSVVVKGHPSQPATSTLCALIVRTALAETPGGADVLQLLHGCQPVTARELVASPQIKAVGFTGSITAGRSLFNVAAARAAPVPFYGELGSLNPLFIGAHALAERSAEITTGLAASIANGAGQFCTKPGLIFLPAGDTGRAFVTALAATLDAMPPGVMLNENIKHLLANRLQASALIAGSHSATQREWPRESGFHATPWLFVTDDATFAASPELHEEHFGPVSIAVLCAPERMKVIAGALGGQLTGTIHAAAGDEAWATPLADVLTQHVGRLIWNGYPTGVTVVPAMQHGGPYPSSTSSLHSAVGATAIRRFLRPVAYQNWPDAMLPPELQAANPLKIERTVNGRRTYDAV